MTLEVPLERVCFLPNVVAGMNPLVLMHLAYLMRATDHQPTPVRLRQVGEVNDQPMYRIVDGRHRVVGALVAGRSSILAEVE